MYTRKWDLYGDGGYGVVVGKQHFRVVVVVVVLKMLSRGTNKYGVHLERAQLNWQQRVFTRPEWIDQNHI
jgi:hypothetical protein